ncbi:MAG: anaerobic ribonucleoside-triphosphate reductase [Candidatus Korarchaeum sp.]|nr:anaerobic ribonucleoside-triphosphate reductase [Candidatus Korarchaeum sp.]
MDGLISLLEGYLSGDDNSRHNANLIYSLPSLAGMLSGYVQREYYLKRVLTEKQRLLHEEGWWYHHQMAQLSPYCAGFSALDIMRYGLQSLNRFSVKSRPPRHLRTFLDQAANFILKVSQEVSGAVALNDLTSVTAAYLYYERKFLMKELRYEDVKNAFQSFVYNVNLDFRSGNSPFTNVTITIGGPSSALLDEPIVIGITHLGRFSDVPSECYDEVKEAFFDVMAEGDAEGKPWTFPLITLYVTDDLDWGSRTLNKLLDLMDDFGGIYFENYLSKPFSDDVWRERVSGLEPRDPRLQRSFCCRFQVDLSELMRVPHTGSIFGNLSGVGSVGVITLNFNRLAYLHRGDLRGLLEHLDELLEEARDALNRKRDFILKHKELYPTLFYYVDRSLRTYFNTISLGGGHEGLVNFGVGQGILCDEGLTIAKEVADHILTRLKEFQEADGIAWNFEYAPMETAAGYLARKDLEFVRYLKEGGRGFRMFEDLVRSRLSEWGEVPEIYVSASPERPILTSGFQPPFSERNLSKLVYISAHTQNYATGGSVLHLFVGERMSGEVKKKLVRRIFSNYPVKYMTITPTLTLCNSCGSKLVGERLRCPSCGSDDTTVYSRVVGYFRPIARRIRRRDAERGIYDGDENVWQDSRRADWVTRAILSEDEIEEKMKGLQ